jgi:hypothetical protein
MCNVADGTDVKFCTAGWVNCCCPRDNQINVDTARNAALNLDCRLRATGAVLSRDELGLVLSLPEGLLFSDNFDIVKCHSRC